MVFLNMMFILPPCLADTKDAKAAAWMRVWSFTRESQTYLTFLFRSWLGSVAASSPISRGFRNFRTNFKSGWKAVNASWKTEIRSPVNTMQSVNSFVHLSEAQNIYWCENGNATTLWYSFSFVSYCIILRHIVSYGIVSYNIVSHLIMYRIVSSISLSFGWLWRSCFTLLRTLYAVGCFSNQPCDPPKRRLINIRDCRWLMGHKRRKN